MTDPARTTKGELLPCPFCGAAALLEDDDAGCMNDQCILACFAYPLERWNQRADAADALRAQVAALQAESSELRSIRELCARRPALDKSTLYDNIAHAINTAKRADKAEAELAAAQAKLAVPVPKDVEDLIAWLDTKWRRHGEIEDRNARDALAALARDNAALRTKAEALERERTRLDWLETMHVEVRKPARYGSRAFFHAAPDLEEVKSNLRARVDAALAEKP